jgi:AcrR family transcriptional regulator
MRRRASNVDETRRRITEAAVRLHTTVGPSETSFAAVAAEAGVTRLTLYRHFENADKLFSACMSHWREQHPPPDFDAWRTVRSFGRRLRRAIADLYAWYDENGNELYPLYRDTSFTPASTHRARRENIERMTDAILADRANDASHAPRAAIGHVLGFWAWRSLVVEEQCSSSEAVDLAARFVLASRRRRVRRAAHNGA